MIQIRPFRRRSTAQNSLDNFPCYHPNSYHCSDVISGGNSVRNSVNDPTPGGRSISEELIESLVSNLLPYTPFYHTVIVHTCSIPKNDFVFLDDDDDVIAEISEIVHQ